MKEDPTIMAETKLKLSPSSLGLFLDCPRCFWLRMNHRTENQKKD